MKLKDLLKLTNPCEVIHLVIGEESEIYFDHLEMKKYFNCEVTYFDAWEYEELRIFINKQIRSD